MDLPSAKDQMKLRWILRDGKKVLQQQLWSDETYGETKWGDVPEHEEPKEPEYKIGFWWASSDVPDCGRYGPCKASASAIRLIDERLVNQFVIICEGIIEYYEHDGKKPHPYNWAKNVLDTYRKHVGRPEK